MTTMTTPHHQVAAATAHMRGIADGVVDASVWSMPADEAASTRVELTRLEAQVVELKARVAMHADEVQVGADVAPRQPRTGLRTRPSMAEEEAKAATARRLTMTDDGRGKVHGRFRSAVPEGSSQGLSG